MTDPRRATPEEQLREVTRGAVDVHTLSAALKALDEWTGACVIKADGLASGKGVIVSPDAEAARALAARAIVVVEDLGVFKEGAARDQCLELRHRDEVVLPSLLFRRTPRARGVRNRQL